MKRPRKPQRKRVVCDVSASVLLCQGFYRDRFPVSRGGTPIWKPLCGCAGCIASRLFHKLSKLHGRDQASRIFKAIASPTGRQLSHWEDQRLFLSFYGSRRVNASAGHAMSVRKFSHSVAKRNADILKYGWNKSYLLARASTDENAIRMQVNRMRKKAPP